MPAQNIDGLEGIPSGVVRRVLAFVTGGWSVEVERVKFTRTRFYLVSSQPFSASALHSHAMRTKCSHAQFADPRGTHLCRHSGAHTHIPHLFHHALCLTHSLRCVPAHFSHTLVDCSRSPMPTATQTLTYTITAMPDAAICFNGPRVQFQSFRGRSLSPR